MEDSQAEDYAIRIGDYQDHLLRITFREYASRLSDRIEQFVQEVGTTEKELKELTQRTVVRNLEFLGFFAALVSFLIASIQIVAKQPFPHAAQLIIVLTGGLLCAFSGFSMLLHGKEYLARTLIAFLLGSLVIAAGLILVPKFISTTA